MMNERLAKIFALSGLAFMIVGYNLQFISAHVHTIDNFDKIYSIGVLCFCASIMNVLTKWIGSYLIFALAFNACLDECVFNPCQITWGEWLEAFILVIAIVAYFQQVKWRAIKGN